MSAPAAPPGPGSQGELLLEVARLSTRYESPSGPFLAVEGASLRVLAGETLAVVGESGCGKTALALSIPRLLPRGGRIVDGEVRYRSVDLRRLPEPEMRLVRGAEIGMVFQDPLAALDPVRTVGAQVEEAVRLDEGVGRAEARDRAVGLLARAGLAEPARVARELPHRLSGGMRQRAMIAVAIARDPALIVADEPTSALDATVEAGILDLFRELQESSGTGMLLVTHDLAVVARSAQRAAVMYGGKVVETAGVRELLAAPLHPYTTGLLRSHPARARLAGHASRLEPIPGQVPSPGDRPSGCRFRDRCPIARPRCAEEVPELAVPASAGADRAVACHYPGEAGAP